MSGAAETFANPKISVFQQAFLKNKSATTVIFAFISTYFLTRISGNLSWYEKPLCLFFGLLFLFVVLAGNKVFDTTTGSLLTRFANFLKKRGAFSSNPELEAPKFGLIRIAFGFFLLERAFWIVSYLQPSDWQQPTVWIAAVANLLCALCIMMGSFTQIALVFLIIIQWQIGDVILSTVTLGNDIGALFATLLLFANAGAHFSIDKWIMNRSGPLGRFISLFYYKHGLPSEATLQNIKFLTLGGYWCVCLYSLSMHLGESAWMTGVAGPQLLSNNFMSRFSAEFEWFFSLGALPILLGRIALWGMLPWYLLLLPCVIVGGWFRAYVIAWGVLFFALSIAVLELGWLAHFEFLFFAALFWEKTFINGPKAIHVAYDDTCNLCDRAVSFIKAVDIFRRIELKPLSKNIEWLQGLGIDPLDAQKDLYAIQTDKNNLAVKGYEFYTAISARLLLLVPLYPILVIGRHLGGPAIYRFIADRRTEVFGVCQVPTHKVDHLALPAGENVQLSIARGDPIVPTFLHMMILAIAFIVTMPTPYLRASAPVFLGEIRTTLALPSKTAFVYGMTPIDVFNQTDLRMAENWFTISIKSVDGSEKLLPILSPDGKRLEFHRSDRMYFGNTLRFRRAVIGSTGCQFDAYRPMFNYLVEGVHAAPGMLVYRQYHEPLPRLDLLKKGQYVAGERTLICETTY